MTHQLPNTGVIDPLPSWYITLGSRRSPALYIELNHTVTLGILYCDGLSSRLCPRGSPRRPIFFQSTTPFTPLVTPMSASDHTASLSTDNFTAIFNAASTEYYNATGKRLDTHLFAVQLNVCHSPDAVCNLLRTQAHAFSKFRERDEKLMAWLNPIIHILFTFSATLAEGIGLVSRLVHSFHMTVLRYLDLSLSRPRRRYLQVLVFYSG